MDSLDRIFSNIGERRYSYELSKPGNIRLCSFDTGLIQLEPSNLARVVLFLKIGNHELSGEPSGSMC